ncbi:hypothetical protein [Actinotalea sp.]|uniref:hypothetical protein n=1 Tax=Actinotalea sp. TaxID=1872145 RepID=UPI00356845EE
MTVVEHSRDEADVRLLLFSLGLVEACEGVENPPQACGHPASSRRRRSTGKGFQCDECLRAGARVRHARERARRVTAS